MRQTRIISIVSGKGGVGKTTVTSNIGVVLSGQQEDVLIIDGNFTGANIATHMGMESQDVFLNDVLQGDAYISQAVAEGPKGVSVLPADISDTEAEDIKHCLIDFLGVKDYVLIDAATGLGNETKAAIKASDEVLLVSNPERPSLTNTLAAKRLTDQLNRDVIGLVINEIKAKTYELENESIRSFVDEEIIGQIPDHQYIRESIALKSPVVCHKPNSRVSHAIEDISYKIRGKEPPERGLSAKLRYMIHKIYSG